MTCLMIKIWSRRDKLEVSHSATKSLSLACSINLTKWKIWLSSYCRNQGFWLHAPLRTFHSNEWAPPPTLYPALSIHPWVRHGRLPHRQGLMKDASQLHHGKCRVQLFWSLTHAKAPKLEYLSLCCFNFDHFFSTATCDYLNFMEVTPLTGVVF